MKLRLTYKFSGLCTFPFYGVVSTALLLTNFALAEVEEPSPTALTADSSAADAYSKEESDQQATVDHLEAETEAAEDIPPDFDKSAASREVVLILDQLRDLEGRFDAYDMSIGEMSLDLADRLAELGDTENALVAYRRALHIMRVNNGLDTDTQIPVLESIHNTQVEARLFEDAVTTLSRIYWVHLQNSNPNDPRLIDVLKRIGTWHLSANYFTIDNKGLSHLIAAHGALAKAHSISQIQNQPYDFDLYNTLSMVNYSLALHVGNDAESSNAIDGSASSGETYAQLSLISGAFRRGKALLQKGIEHARQSGNLENMVRATLLYGDWNQLFKKRYSARDMYALAYQLANQLDEGHSLQRTFERPQKLPYFDVDALEFTPDPIETFPIKLEFNVNGWGQSSDVLILDEKTRENRHAHRTAIKSVRSAIYRPTLLDGQPIDFIGVKQTIVVPK